MGSLHGSRFLLVVALALTGCATGEPRLQGTWKSHKVPMPVETVKVTKMETVRVRKGSRKTKKVPKTVTLTKTQSAPPYIDLVLKYEGSSLTMMLPSANGEPMRKKIPYKVVSSDVNSVAIALPQPGTKTMDYIQITFDGPNRYWVAPANGEGWKEYYSRVK
jgi:hypothetical protein